jgi:hypothetical protein
MLLPDESNTDASRRSIAARQHKLSVFNELVPVICSKTARLQTANETFGYTRVYKVIIVDLTQSRRYAFAPFHRRLENSAMPQPPNPPCTKGGKEEDTCLGGP